MEHSVCTQSTLGVPVEEQKCQEPGVIQNTDSILEKIAHLYAEQLMSDIILVVGGQQYPAHRVILCASSEVFQVMLMNPQWNECRKRTIELYEEPCCAAVFPQFLKYLYVGQLKATLQSVMPVLALADKYNVKDLVQPCVNFMLSHIAKAAAQGYMVSWLKYTIAFSPFHKDLTEALKNFLKWNIEMVSESRDFVDLDTQVMVLLLQQNDIVVKSEAVLFSILQKWLMHRKNILDSDDSLSDVERDAALKELIEATVSHIRFAMMNPKEMSQMLLCPLLSCHREFFIRKMANGMGFHSGLERVIKQTERPNSNALDFTPRLYTGDQWCVNFNITDFHKIPDYTPFVACFFSQRSLAEREDDQSVTWEIEFFPRGLKYNKAKMVWGVELPECSLRTVRLRVTCKESAIKEERFKVAALISGMQHEFNYILTVHERTEYFSDKCRVLNLDNLLPYEELTMNSKSVNPHLIGENRENINVQVIIIPMGPATSRDSPPFDLK